MTDLADRAIDLHPGAVSFEFVVAVDDAGNGFFPGSMPMINGESAVSQAVVSESELRAMAESVSEE